MAGKLKEISMGILMVERWLDQEKVEKLLEWPKVFAMVEMWKEKQMVFSMVLRS